jgi:eukaryotic-like serine/threonine-protein kinase
MTPAPDPSTAAFNEKYLLVRKLADGGMGSVWEAVQLGLRRRVAVKLVHPHLASDELAVQRFMREAIVLAQLDHPNAVRVFDFGTDGERPYIAMEFVDGQSAEAELLAKGPLPLQLVATIADQVLAVLEAAHRLGIIHRDLKPANLMLERPRDGIRVKVVDFGIALIRRVDAARLTQSGTMVGTAYYMSPEQCRGEGCDLTTDLYSLACSLFELLTGRPPFNALAPADVMAGHLFLEPPLLEPGGAGPSALDRALHRALRKRPSERFATASEMRAELALAFANPSRGDPVRPAERAPGAPAAIPRATVAVVAVTAQAADGRVQLALAAAGLTPLDTSGAALPGDLAAAVVLGTDPQPALAQARALLASHDHLQVVVVCDAGDFQVMREAVAAGIFAVVSLPLDPVELVKNVARALRRPRR